VPENPPCFFRHEHAYCLFGQSKISGSSVLFSIYRLQIRFEKTTANPLGGESPGFYRDLAPQEKLQKNAQRTQNILKNGFLITEKNAFLDVCVGKSTDFVQD
jgi:hypothetical protein